MARSIYLNFNNSTQIKSDNTSTFTVTTNYYSGSTKTLINGGNSDYSNWDSTSYQIYYGGAGNDNNITYSFGLYDTFASQEQYTGLTYSTFNGANYAVNVNPGAGLIEIDASGECHTTAFGEVTSVTPGQVAVVSGDTVYSQYSPSNYTGSGLNYTAYTHQDLTQISTIDAQGNPMPPALVVRCVNTNFDSHSGDTVTLTVQYTGVTYVSGGTSTTTTYTGQFPPVTFNRSLSNGYNGTDGPSSNPSSQTFTKIYDFLPDQVPTIGIHRGLWTFNVSITSNNTYASNKYGMAFMINNG
jgi:hypothetical protein